MDSHPLDSLMELHSFRLFGLLFQLYLAIPSHPQAPVPFKDEHQSFFCAARAPYKEPI